MKSLLWDTVAVLAFTSLVTAIIILFCAVLWLAS